MQFVELKRKGTGLSLVFISSCAKREMFFDRDKLNWTNRKLPLEILAACFTLVDHVPRKL